jgi:hypothetical protein
MNNKLQRESISRPGEPTDASPGSARKIRVLMERAARREPLFHPQDNLKRLVPIISSEPGPEPEAVTELELDLDLEHEPEERPEEMIEADLAG